MSFYSIAFIENGLMALDLKIEKMQTWLNSKHNHLLFDDRPKGCTLLKKETLVEMFSCEFCEISRSNFFYRTHIGATVFGLSFINPRTKSVKELVS